MVKCLPSVIFIAKSLNPLYHWSLQDRYGLDVSRIRFHVVRHLPNPFGYRLSVRLHAYGKQKVGIQAMQGEDDAV